MDNIGVNFDFANLILYGKASPDYAVDILGPFIKSVHIKDGRYPTETKKLGEETPIGEGDANIPKLIEKLFALGFKGPLTIEREISGQEQIEEVKKAVLYLNALLSNM
jgi:sugar phosphate isomerase/epimerase